MRDHRAGLARFVRDRRVLNTFAYTGALSLAAARAGAAAVTSVDLAGGPLAWARENFRLSGSTPKRRAFAGRRRTCSTSSRPSASAARPTT